MDIPIPNPPEGFMTFVVSDDREALAAYLAAVDTALGMPWVNSEGAILAIRCTDLETSMDGTRFRARFPLQMWDLAIKDRVPVPEGMSIEDISDYDIFWVGICYP